MQENKKVKLLNFLFAALIMMSAPAFAGELPRLQTSGNQFETPEGKRVDLRGVSLCSLEWHKPLEQIKAAAETWKPNIIRLPVQPREWVKTPPLKYLQNRLDPAVKLCGELGLYCIIDWHGIHDWDDAEKTKNLENFWKIVAPRYATNKNIIYEVFNEPVGPSEKSEENWLKFRKEMQVWVDSIRTAAPHTVILVGSPHWSQLTSFAAENPLEGKNLAYVMHAYPNYKPASWDKAFGNAAKKVPVFLSEWGWSTVEGSIDVIRGTKEEYGVPMKQYLQENPQIGWTAWSYDPLCGPAMLGPDAEMGEFVKTWLEEETKKPD
jgi:endoglucanase